MTTAKALTQEQLMAFIGGQFKSKSGKEPTRRGQILAVILSGTVLNVRFAWSAIKHGKTWLSDTAEEHSVNLALCEYREDVGGDAGVIRISCPYLDLAITLYPPGHKKNIEQSDIRPKPAGCGVA